MDNNKVLNVSCNFNGYLVCQIPENTVEMELKIKTTRSKYTLNTDTYTRTERYHPWDRADRRAQIHTRKRRTPIREITNPNYVATLPQTETESSELEVMQNNFIGEYCEKCIKKYNRCWCNGLDWCCIMLFCYKGKIQQYNQINCYADANPKFTFIFCLSPYIISGNDTYTFKGQLIRK